MANDATVSGHAHDEHHPDWSVYWKVATFLVIITAVEVSAYSSRRGHRHGCMCRAC